jgi:hemin uptake protein HemP
MPNSDETVGEGDQHPVSPTPAPPLAARPVIFRSEELFAGGQEVWIEHAGDMYRLRITASGKLLLTK